MRTSSAHRGVLTTTSQTHVCDDGKLEEFIRRQRSRIQHTTDLMLVRYRRRIQEAADARDEYTLRTRGLSQPTCLHARVEEEA